MVSYRSSSAAIPIRQYPQRLRQNTCRNLKTCHSRLNFKAVHPLSLHRSLFGALALLLSMSASCGAMDTPLSPEAVRQAYFLGQRHDQSLAQALAQYTKRRPAPLSGPYISAISFLTPFALLAQLSAQHTVNYSAQQAAIAQRSRPEVVKVLVDIQLTPTYSALLPVPAGSDSGASFGFLHRPYTFWKGFVIKVSSNRKVLTPSSTSGEPRFAFSHDGSCVLSGASVCLVFPAVDFTSDSVSISVTPPEGDRVAVVFDLSSIR